MQQVYVKFDDVEHVRNFLNVIEKFETDFDLGSGRRIVDAKSVLGVFALDLTKPQRLRFESEDQEIFEKLKPFLA